MKYLKQFDQYNENIFGDIKRLDPNRAKSDEKAIKLFEDIIKDYYENNNDLKKVKIIDDDKSAISLDKIKIGKNYTLSYVFGKYHPVLRDIHSGNREAGDRRIQINSIPFSITLRKNSLEKIFNTKRINKGRVTVKDVKTNHNYDRNPNIGNHALYKEKIDEYTISSDIANQIFNFFINEYNKKYPELGESKYKGSMSIRDIEKNINPVIKYIDVKSKDNKNVTVAIRKGDDISEIKNMIKNMTESEYNEYHKKKNKELYKSSEDKMKIRVKEIGKKIDKLLKDNGINLKSTEWEEYGFTLTGNIDYDFTIQFMYDKDISNLIKSLIKNGFDHYSIELINDNEYNNIYFYAIKFTKN